jgi:hypothetical protein
MADFLTRLAERSVGMGPSIRPDLSPVAMASPASTEAGALGQNDEVQVNAIDRFAEIMQPLQKGSIHSVTRPAAVGEIDKSHLIRPETSVAEAPNTFPPEAARSFETSRSIDRALSPERVEATVSREAAGHRLLTARVNEQSSNQLRSIISPEIKIAPHQTTSPLATVNQAPAQAPTIQVRIGRIEVRASDPSPPPMQRPVERKASTTQSLDDYLRERNQGRGRR